MTAALLIVGITIGLCCGVLITGLKTRREMDDLQEQLYHSVPKIKVIRALNRNKNSGRRISDQFWNGAIESVWHDLKEDLK